jgi:hypothetical protein
MKLGNNKVRVYHLNPNNITLANFHPSKLMNTYILLVPINA